MELETGGGGLQQELQQLPERAYTIIREENLPRISQMILPKTTNNR